MNKRIIQGVVAVAAITTMSFITAGSVDWMAGKDNTLSPQEKKEGWKLLFDGTSTKGWRTYQNKTSDGWLVANGELSCKLEGVKKRADLITAEKYDNFELSIDWKVAKGANSGIVYRATEAYPSSY